MKKRNILSTIFSVILSLFLAIVMLASALCLYADKTICNPDALQTAAEESGYPEELYEQIKYAWENLLAITGVTDPDSIMEVLTPEQVKTDALTYLQDAYTGTITLNTDALRSELDTRVRNYAYSNNIHATPQAELEQNIKDLVNACMQSYEMAIRIPVIPRFLSAVSAFRTYLKPAAIAGGAFCLLLLVFLFFLQRKRADFLYYAALSVGTNAVLMIGGVWLAGYYQLVERIPIAISALRSLLCTYLNALLDKLRFFGYGFLMLAAVLLAVYFVILLIGMLLRRFRAKKTISNDTEIA